MIYFTADLHFYHENIIKHAKRPFYNADEMNRALIKKWNSRIDSEDEVYILGDFTMKGSVLAESILYNLKGKKHLIRGNHDKFADQPEFNQALFVSIRDYAEIIYANTRFILFHYPILEWYDIRRGSIMLHGHQHNHADYNLNNQKESILRYDVGVDANDMEPVCAEKIIEFFHKKGVVNA